MSDKTVMESLGRMAECYCHNHCKAALIGGKPQPHDFECVENYAVIQRLSAIASKERELEDKAKTARLLLEDAYSYLRDTWPNVPDNNPDDPHYMYQWFYKFRKFITPELP